MLAQCRTLKQEIVHETARCNACRLLSRSALWSMSLLSTEICNSARFGLSQRTSRRVHVQVTLALPRLKVARLHSCLVFRQVATVTHGKMLASKRAAGRCHGAERPYDLVTTDVDGTLLNSRNELSARNEEAITECIKLGIPVRAHAVYRQHDDCQLQRTICCNTSYMCRSA